MYDRVASAWAAGALCAYFAVTLAIGWLARRPRASANDYLNASRSLPLWIVVAAFLAANCGALEIIGMSALAAEYGVQVFHFYWVGAIPAMIALSLWVMPAYRKGGIRSVPEYLEYRFGRPLRTLNAAVTAGVCLLLAGISLYAMGEVLEAILHLAFIWGLLLSATVVLTYVLVGGVRATIYNEVFQLGVMLAGLTPLAILSWRAVASHRAGAGERWHAWRGMPLASAHAPFDALGLVLGLGFVMSFAYWCTDFVQIQRALAARTDLQARQVPLWAGFGKLLVSLMVVFPGVAAWALLPGIGQRVRFDEALPAVMRLFYSPALLGLGLTALTASLMSGFAANVSAFASVWTQDLYRSHVRRNEPEQHYVRMGRWAALICVATGAGVAFVSFRFRNLMDEVQMIFSLFAAPFFAVFVLGLATRRATLRGATRGVLTGIAVAIVHHLCVWQGLIHYGSLMSANFHVAIYSFATALVVGWVNSRPEERLAESRLEALVVKPQDLHGDRGSRALWILTVCLVLTWVALEFAWW